MTALMILLASESDSRPKITSIAKSVSIRPRSLNVRTTVREVQIILDSSALDPFFSRSRGLCFSFRLPLPAAGIDLTRRGKGRAI